MSPPSSAYYLLKAGFLLGLLDPEDKGDMFLRTSVDFQWTTRHYIPEDRILHNPLSKNIKSCIIFLEYTTYVPPKEDAIWLELDLIMKRLAQLTALQRWRQECTRLQEDKLHFPVLKSNPKKRHKHCSRSTGIQTNLKLRLIPFSSPCALTRVRNSE
jgi:hypothetical protein